MDYPIRLFVYDDLRKNAKHHSLLQGATPLNMQSWTDGELRNSEEGFPFLVDNPADRVYGELYSLTKNTFRKITKFLKNSEETVELTRKVIQTDEGEKEAYTIFYPDKSREAGKRIAFGDWKTYLHLKEKEFLYFAYGSCMDDQRLIKAGVDSLFQQVEGRGTLEGYSLGYTIPGEGGGRADIIENEQDTVEGKVYRVNRKAVEYLFAREGVHGKKYRPAFIDIEVNGIQVKNVLTFIVLEKKEEIAPPEHYALEIIRGAEGLVSDEYYRQLHTNLLDKFEMSVPIEQYSTAE